MQRHLHRSAPGLGAQLLGALSSRPRHERAMLASRPSTSGRRVHAGSSAAGDFSAQQPADAAAAAERAELGNGGLPEQTGLEQAEPAKQGFGARLKRFFLGEKFDRKRLAALGLGAVASYGFVSNATYGTGMAVSWIAFVRRTGQSPLQPGQWKAFLAFFAGFWTIQNFLRPFRFTIAVALAPAFDRIILFLQRRMGLSRRNAFGLYLFLFGSLTSVLVFGSIFLFAGPQAFARA